MKLIHFLNEFPDEESSKLFIVSHRKKPCIYCKNCQNFTLLNWFRGVKFFEFMYYRRRSSLKSGAVLENSKLPLHIWMLTFLFVSAIKSGVPLMEFMQQLELSRYETAFKLKHKITGVIGRRDSLSLLKDMAEYD